MNENQNKPKQKEETPKTIGREASAAKSGSGWKRLLSKKWVTPAAFLAAAAIIVTLMWIYQGADTTSKTSTTTPSEATEGTAGGEATAAPQDEEAIVDALPGNEKLEWPVLNRDKLDEVLSFYDSEAGEEERAAAVVQSGDTFTPHVGVDLSDPNGETFDVVAALSGKVSHVEKHPTNGNVVEIDHGNGLVTIYESLSDVSVAEGDEVKQGSVIAKAGRSDAERDLGVHVHFEVRVNGEAKNPAELMEQQ
ncbi:peptidoglycan DD-metalloendopeptidase family protein [Paenibacillus thailandensis]|uniref:Peptidoglycan DD-metalloendopeptidase family protein n=1 Tax=Paenibacillus thailandensis TaxID=393250 RepID=A0ABW5R3Z5_9BACL